jgi:hypothetical protein
MCMLAQHTPRAPTAADRPHAASSIWTSENPPSTSFVIKGKRKAEASQPRRWLTLKTYLPAAAHCRKSSPMRSIGATGCTSVSKLA